MDVTLIFQRVSDAIRFLLQQQEVRIFNYIDNTVSALESTEAHEKFELICNTIEELGLPLNKSKVQGPSKKST